MEKRVIIVTGWHYNRHVYSNLKKLENTEVIVINHRKDFNETGFETYTLPNTGFDWGCYKQGMKVITEKGIKFSNLYLIHDDLIFKTDANILFNKADELLKEYKVIGNGDTQAQIQEKTFRHPGAKGEKYRRIRQWVETASGIKVILPFRYVRGSFVGLTREVFQKIKSFPIKEGNNINLGNWSLFAFAAYIKYHFGDCVGFLGEKYCDSPYLEELKRGI